VVSFIYVMANLPQKGEDDYDDNDNNNNSNNNLLTRRLNRTRIII